jgi:hypothetical protein
MQTLSAAAAAGVALTAMTAAVFLVHPSQPVTMQISVHRAAGHDISPPLASLKDSGTATGRADCDPDDDGCGVSPADPDDPDAPPQARRPDPPPVVPPPVPAAGAAVEQKSQGSRSAVKAVASFDGLGFGFDGPQGGGRMSNPSDNSLAVGLDRVVQIVNSRFAVFDKSGKVVYGSVATNTVFKGFGGTCEARNNGDAVVRYDQLAHRWLFVMPIFSRITERPEEPYSMCYAVSTGEDPLGPYARYEFRRKLFPDYPRPAVWPDGYYIPSSTGDEVIQKHACIADRAKMLTGGDATEQCVIIDGVNFLNNADVDGPNPPPAGAPNIMMAAGGTQLKKIFDDDGIFVYKLHVDWANPANTKASEAVKIPVAPYHYLCNGQLTSCVPQPGTARRLDAQGDKIMQRLVYRNSGDHESLLAVHSINTSPGGGGVRWYEFRLDAKRDPYLYQQSTYAPDAFFRWMASPGMDRQGNIGIGYSFGGAPNFAGQRFAARLASDPLGQLGFHETVLVEGEAAQTNTLRWEDYASTAMDPTDDCTFWYVGDYLKKDATAYTSRIGAFRVPGCLSGTVAGSVYLDVNHNGKRDPGEPGIGGRPVNYSGSVSGKATTDASGSFRLSLAADPAYGDPTYAISAEGSPAVTVHLKDRDAVKDIDFPSVCTVRGTGGADLSYWTGSKGKAVLKAHHVDAPKGLKPHAAATELVVLRWNVEFGGLDGNATVQDPVKGDWPAVRDLIGRASADAEQYRPLVEMLNRNSAMVTPSKPAGCGAR